MNGDTMTLKPNFTYKRGEKDYHIHVNLLTGVVTDTETGYVFKYKRSETFWNGIIFKPIVDETSGATQDNVNSPSHYGQGEIEAIDYIKDTLTEEEWIGYLRGNISKYLHRWRYKNGLEDLKKAQWYLNRLIETQEKED
jgi:hypothetical protein